MSCISIPPLRDDGFRELDVLYYLIVASSVPNWVQAAGELDFASRRGKEPEKACEWRGLWFGEQEKGQGHRVSTQQRYPRLAESGEGYFGQVP